MSALTEELSRKLAEVQEVDEKRTELAEKIREEKLAHSKLVASMDGDSVNCKPGAGGEQAISIEKAWQVLLGQDVPPPVQAQQLLDELKAKVAAAHEATKGKADEAATKKAKLEASDKHSG